MPGAGAGQLVFAHPSNLEGVRVAMQSGVDVLAHAPDTVKGVDDALIHDLVARHMAMIPTLKLFSGDSDIAAIRAIVAKFHRLRRSAHVRHRHRFCHQLQFDGSISPARALGFIVPRRSAYADRPLQRSASTFPIAKAASPWDRTGRLRRLYPPIPPRATSLRSRASADTICAGRIIRRCQVTPGRRVLGSHFRARQSGGVQFRQWRVHRISRARCNPRLYVPVSFGTGTGLPRSEIATRDR